MCKCKKGSGVLVLWVGPQCLSDIFKNFHKKISAKILKLDKPYDLLI